MSDLTAAIAFGTRLYSERARIAYAGYVRRSELALLGLRPGRKDPYALYERLRAKGTLTQSLDGSWVTTSHRVCDAVLRDRRFGAAPAAGDPGRPGPEDFDTSFLELNPPEHTRLRRLATPAFSARAVAGYTTRIEKTVGGLLDQALGVDGPVDLVAALAAPLPIAVITELLGIPDHDTAKFTRYGMLIGSALDGIRSLRHAAQLMAAQGELIAMFENLFELRRKEPRDDVVSHIVAAEGDQIQPAEMFPLCGLLLVAGFETTVNLIGNGALALLAHPDQWRLLRDDPEGMAARTVDEMLRYDSPVQLTGRFALEDIELEGKPVRKGQAITTLLAAANHDPEVYPEPDRFDITRRDPVPHLSFSTGIHYCLGQPLAKLEGTIVFRMLAERVSSLALAGKVRRRNRVIIRGPYSLPVRLA